MACLKIVTLYTSLRLQIWHYLQLAVQTLEKALTQEPSNKAVASKLQEIKEKRRIEKRDNEKLAQGLKKMFAWNRVLPNEAFTRILKIQYTTLLAVMLRWNDVIFHLNSYSFSYHQVRWPLCWGTMTQTCVNNTVEWIPAEFSEKRWVGILIM